jgi:hypothetical protein
MSSRQKKSLKGGADAPFPIFNHPILDAYLKMNLITSLMPTTLIPLGVLMAVYSTLSQQEVQKGGFQAMSVVDPLVKDYMGLFGIYELTALTLIPFAFLLGRDMFEQVMSNYKKAEGVPAPAEVVQQGGVANWMDVPVLDTFLKMQGNLRITPATLVPLGILAVVYYAIRGKKAEQEQKGGAMPAFLSNPTLQKYMDMMGISTLTSQTMLPFALIISKELFDRYVRQNKTLLESITP